MVTLKRYEPASWQDLPEQWPDIVKHTLARRGVTHQSQLQLALRSMAHMDALFDIHRVAERLAQAIVKQEKTVIVGDFDADGATSVALFIRVLRAMQARQVDYLVPNRFDHGYGISAALVEQAYQQGAQVIVTVDNGMSAFEAADKAKELGIDLIVTDHHLPSTQLPAAFAIVNPNHPECQFPSKYLAGVGVSFYVLIAVRSWFRQHQADHPAAQVALDTWLDIVALGTLCDLVPLDQNNRILIRSGMQRIKQRRCAPGILALLKQAKRDVESLTAQDVGFVLGPRINAAGRLDDISIGIELLTTDDPIQASQLAQQLDELNRSRRAIQEDMLREAEASMQSLEQLQQPPPLLTLYEPSWHQGVIGIVAGKLKEHYFRPTIVFAQDETGILKGSARSIPGVHIRDFLAQLHSEQPDLLRSFGGHAMAAGLTIQEQDYSRFQEASVELAQRWIDARYLDASIWSDGELTPDLFQVSFCDFVEGLGPWGQGFEPPLFDGIFRVVQLRWLKEKHLKLTLEIPGTDVLVDALAFFVQEQRWALPPGEYLHLAYRLSKNTFRGQTQLQLMIEHVWPATEKTH